MFQHFRLRNYLGNCIVSVRHCVTEFSGQHNVCDHDAVDQMSLPYGIFHQSSDQHLEKVPDPAFRFFEGNEYEMEQAHKASPFDLILMYDSLTIAASNRTVPATVSPHVLIPSGHPFECRDCCNLVMFGQSVTEYQ